MRHRISGNRLSRNRSLRKATIRDMVKSVLLQERICTTSAKAKEARKTVEKMITLGKRGSLADKRRAFALLCDHNLVSDLFKTIAPRFRSRQGGYTRIITLGAKRRGDNAKLVFLELTEKKEIIIAKPKKAKKAKESPDKTAIIDANVENVETENKATTKDQLQIKDTIKPQTKKHEIETKPKSGRNLMGGLRKMFNRKAPGQ